MNKKNKTPFVWRGFAILFVTVLCLFIPSGCMTTGQQVAGLVEGGGQAWGARYLNSQKVNGVVPPAVLAQYEQNIVGINFVMEGAMTPFEFQSIVSTIKTSSALSSDQQGAVGFLGGVTKEFIKVNSNPLTQDGAVMQAAAEQLASGLADAVNQITGQTFSIPSAPPSS